MLAELYWEGEVLSQDRARAYAWMDMAAERGYRLFIAKREQYWAGLDPVERERALDIGATLLPKIADHVAKPRLAKVLQSIRHQITGHRIGLMGPQQIHLFTEVSYTWVDGSAYYREQYWKPERYFEWTDSIWTPMPQGGRVRVGDPHSSEPAAADGRI
jgi:hypothetical protein